MAKKKPDAANAAEAVAAAVKRTYRKPADGLKADGTVDKRTLKRGEAGYHERNTKAANDACAAKRAERKARGEGDATCIFPTVEEFERAAVDYFDECDRKEEKYSEAGLCLWLSSHNAKNRNVTLTALQNWYDGDAAEHLQEAVQMAYLRIQHQIETDPRYDDKAMTAYRIFLEKQKRLGGKTDKQEVDNNVKFELTIKDYDEGLAK